MMKTKIKGVGKATPIMDAVLLLREDMSTTYRIRF